MTSTQDLIDLVELNPTCDTYAGMLYDHLFGDRDMTHTEATQHVERVRGPALRAWQMAEAARELAPRAKCRGRLLARIAQAVGEIYNYTELVMLVEGTAAPLVVGAPDGYPGVEFGSLAVTVGAEWVLKCVAQTREEWAAYEAARLTPRAKRRRRGGDRH